MMFDTTLLFFWGLSMTPFALWVLVGKRLPAQLWTAGLASLLAGLAAGVASLGAIFTLLGAFRVDPQVIVVFVLLFSVHWAMVEAEASAANFIIGRGARYASKHRELFAKIGAGAGHAIWFWWAYRYLYPSSVYEVDEFSRLCLYMVLPASLMAAPLAALGATFAPRER
jgi:hypothetical protein